MRIISIVATILLLEPYIQVEAGKIRGREYDYTQYRKRNGLNSYNRNKAINLLNSEKNEVYMNRNSMTIKNLNVVYGIGLIAAGILFCILRSSFVSAMLTVAGVLCVMLGIVNLVCRKWVLGGVEMAIGIVVITCGWTVADVALLVLGIVLCAYAIYMFATQISMFKRANTKDKVFILLNPIVTLIIGIMFIVAKWYMVDAVFIALGAVAIAEGIALLFKSDEGQKNDEKVA